MRIAIVGAGIIGSLLAYSLHNAGREVEMFKLKDNKNCSEAAAGLLTPISELEKSDFLIYSLGIEALNIHWPHIIKSLCKNIFFRKIGSIAVSHARDYSELDRTMHIIKSKLHDKNSCKKLESNQLNELEPELIKFDQAYYLSQEGQIDNQHLMSELHKSCIEKGVNIFDALVQKVEPGKVTANSRQFFFDLVIDCRGLGAKEIFKDLRGVRGELMWLHAPKITISRPVKLIHPRYNLYIVPRPNNNYIVGASEIEAEDYSPISLQTSLELLSAAFSISSNFAEARIIRSVSHCRPTLPNNMPKIKYNDGLLAINGLYRHGFLVAPSLVCDVNRWLLNGISAVKYSELWEKQ